MFYYCYINKVYLKELIMVQEELTGRTAKPIEDFFPGVKPEKVEQLLSDPIFKAWHAISELPEPIEVLKAAGQDVARLEELRRLIHQPAMEALSEKMGQAGFSHKEISAAAMAAEGTIKIR